MALQNKKTQFERLTRHIKAENKKLHVRIRRLENMDKEYKASMNRKEKELEKMRKAVRRNVNTSNSKIKHGIKMSHTLQRPDGRRQRWNDDTTVRLACTIVLLAACHDGWGRTLLKNRKTDEQESGREHTSAA